MEYQVKLVNEKHTTVESPNGFVALETAEQQTGVRSKAFKPLADD